MTRATSLRTLPATKVASLQTEAYTYAPVGGTRGQLPAGFHHLRRDRIVGYGEDTFLEAARAVMSWEVQLRSGIRVDASDPVAVEGAVLVLHVGLCPVAVAAPARVVHVVEEARRRGFAYGTLPGHPESGEESFVVEFRGDGAVVFTVTAYSRPGTRLTRTAGPANRAFQRYMAGRYLRTLDRLVG